MSDFESLSIRTQRILHDANINSIAQLIKYDDKKLLKLRKLGLKALNEIKNFLKKQENNGWQKIESEEDLPKDGNFFWVIKKGYDYPLFEPMYHDDGEYWLAWYTHYQPITKPQPPIY